jgi:tetratricopeptide (TPR) repeat protein
MTQRTQLAALSLALIFVTSPAVAGSAAAQSAKKNLPEKKSDQPSASDLLLRDGQQALDRQDYAAAAQLFTKFLDDHPHVAYAHFQLGYAYTALQRRAEAKREFQKAVELDPKMGAAFLNLGLLLLESDPTAAVPALLKAVDLLPSQAEPHYLAGTALERTGNPSGAAQHYREAAKLDESKWEYRIALARVLLATKQAVEAETQFRKSLELRPDYAPARLGLAQCLIAQEKLADAAVALQAYLETAPKDTETRLQLVSVYSDLSRFDEALKELDHADDSAAGEPTAESDRLRVDLLLRAKRYGDAVAPLRRLLGRAPDDAALHARLGRVLMQQRDFPGAQQQLQAALRIDPKLSEVLRDLSSTYLLAENYPAALATLDELAKREQPGPAQWYLRALCYDKLHHLKDAIDAYQKFLATDEGKNAEQEFQARQRVRILRDELNHR